MRRITFDIETAGNFLGNGNFDNLEVTVVGAHDSQSGEFSSYLKADLPKLWQLLERADIIVGYNCDHFDIPILNRYYAGDLGTIKSVDLLKEIRSVLGRRLKLDNVGEATLGRRKTADGAQAQEWWKQGEVEKIREYCLEDVRLTKDLYEYARKNGSLKYRDFGTQEIKEIKLDTSEWETLAPGSSALTHTLPF